MGIKLKYIQTGVNWEMKMKLGWNEDEDKWNINKDEDKIKWT